MSIKRLFSDGFVNFSGWRTDRRIVVIESDDWGSIRMSSREVYDALLRKGYKVHECHYNRNDALESNEDLEDLFDVLTSVKDSLGNHAVMTANNIVANPDFGRIRSSDFRQYYYEPFSETLKKYPKHDKVYELYKKGIEEKIFVPQFHGREHVNRFTWLRDLKIDGSMARDIFNLNMFTTHKDPKANCRTEYLDSFGARSADELSSIKESVAEGLELFEKLWGFKSDSFVATCYNWHPKTEAYLNAHGIKHIQSSRVQVIPQMNSERNKIKRLFTGKRNVLGQFYTVRNVIFEPSQDPRKEWVSSSLNEIRTAFRWHRPAIICSHRVNYIGFINQQNRDRGLKLLNELLAKVVRTWPDVVFTSSAQLGQLIRKSYGA